MTELFMKLLNMSVNAGWLVLAVLLVRIMFHKAPKWLFPLLWSFVWIRLLMPNALESRLSVIPDISGFSASEQGLLSANAMKSTIQKIQTTLMKPEVKKAGTEQIKKKAKSSIIEQLSRKKKEMAEREVSRTIPAKSKKQDMEL